MAFYGRQVGIKRREKRTPKGYKVLKNIGENPIYGENACFSMSFFILFRSGFR
jgi:hypothetical protein